MTGWGVGGDLDQAPTHITTNSFLLPFYSVTVCKSMSDTSPLCRTIRPPPNQLIHLSIFPLYIIAYKTYNRQRVVGAANRPCQHASSIIIITTTPPLPQQQQTETEEAASVLKPRFFHEQHANQSSVKIMCMWCTSWTRATSECRELVERVADSLKGFPLTGDFISECRMLEGFLGMTRYELILNKRITRILYYRKIM